MTRDIPAFERQSSQPLFPKVLWNRPVSRTGAGRLLIPGGHSGELSLITGVHQAAIASGAGEAVAALPDSLVKLLGGTSHVTFVAATPSGSLARESLARLVDLSEEADAVLLGANLSNNSQTTVLVERLLAESPRPVIAFDEAYVSLKHNLRALAVRPGGLLIMTMAEAFKVASALGVRIDIRQHGGLVNKLEIIQDIHTACGTDLAVYGSEVIVASGGRLGVTPVDYKFGQLPAVYVGALAVFWTQNPAARYEGLMTGSFVLGEIARQLFTAPDKRPSLTEAVGALRRYLAEAF